MRIALVRGRQLCTQLSIFEGSLAELFRFLTLSTSKIEEVSQNCFVFDIVKFHFFGCLAELLRFGHAIASFQVDRQKDR